MTTSFAIITLVVCKDDNFTCSSSNGNLTQRATSSVAKTSVAYEPSGNVSILKNGAESGKSVTEKHFSLTDIMDDVPISSLQYNNSIIQDEEKRIDKSVGKTDGLPTNICHSCLYYTETFSEFKNNVRKCEARLQTYIASLGVLGSVRTPIKKELDDNEEDSYDNNIENYAEIMHEENHLVTVVDPNQDYDSSDDSFSMDSDNDFSNVILPRPIGSNGASAILDDKSCQIFPESQENVDKNVYLCQYCDMAFTAQVDCADHEIGHDRMSPHSCNYCAYKCSSRQVLIAHIKEIHDNDRPYICVQCHKGFGRRSDLKKHTIVHTGVRPFTCPVCNKNFSRNTNLTKHLRIHTGLKPHVCQKCPRSFTTTADLVRHQRVHNDNKPFQCQKCSSAFTRKDKLMHHERMHLRKEHQTVSIMPSNTCDTLASSNEVNVGVGSSSFDTESMVISLDPYTDVNQSENTPINTSTDSLQSTPKKLSITPLPPSSLPLLPPPPPPQPSAPTPAIASTTNQNTRLQEHITGDVIVNINSSDDYNNIYSCDYCPQKFSLVSALINHNSTHNIMPGHICPVCSKRFARKRELQRHSVIHTGIKPYACRFCSKRFNRKDKVVRHERIHTEEKFNCTQCELGFSRQEALDMHLKVHELNRNSNAPGLNSTSGIKDAMSLAILPNISNVLPSSFMPQMNFYNELPEE